MRYHGLLKSMIIPVVYYASAILCARPKRTFEMQDQLIAKAARLALHILRTIGRQYVHLRADVEPSYERTLTLARNYQLSIGLEALP